MSDKVRELLAIELPNEIKFSATPRGKHNEIVYYTVYEHFKDLSLAMDKEKRLYYKNLKG